MSDEPKRPKTFEELEAALPPVEYFPINRGPWYRDEIAQLRADLAEAVEMLRGLQWIVGREETTCPICHEPAPAPRGGHAPGCKLAAFLGRQK